MAAPVAEAGSGRYGVRVGMSLLVTAIAPGEPLGQRGMAVCICAAHRSAEENRIKSDSLILCGARVQRARRPCQDGGGGKKNAECRMQNAE